MHILGNRIAVIGCGGSGKSTLSLWLGKLLQKRVIHLDRLFFSANWVEPDRQIWAQILEGNFAEESWIVDGHYGSSLARRFELADTVIILDISRRTAIFRALRRSIRGLGKERADLAPGCKERLDLNFFKWMWKFPYEGRPRMLNAIANTKKDTLFLRLSTDSQINKFLRAVEQNSSELYNYAVKVTNGEFAPVTSLKSK